MITSVIFAVLAIILMAFVPTLVKVIEANEIVIAVIRLLIAAIGLTLFPSVIKNLFLLSKRQWGGLLLIGATFALHWYLYFRSIKLSTPSIGAVAVSTYAMHLILINFLLRRQVVSMVDLSLALLGFVAVIIMVPELSYHSDYFIGAVYGVASGFLYACLPIYHQYFSTITTSVRAWGQFSFALIFYLPFIPTQEWSLSIDNWLMLLALGVFSTLVAHTLWIRATTELSNSISGIVYYLYIPLALIISHLATAESLSISSWLGALTIVIANVLLVIRNRVVLSNSVRQT